MKVKNLLLAGLAVAAMTACSNDIEGVDNSIQDEGTALMQLNFSFPEGAVTRAVNVEEGEDNKGTDNEFNVKTVDVVLKYTTGVETYSFTRDQFEDAVWDNQTKSMQLKVSQVVKAGEVSEAYAFINKAKNLTTSGDWNNFTFEAGSTGFDYLSSSIANVTAKEFLMSGKITQTLNFNEGQQTNVTIPVSRVCAKLDEITTTKTRTVTDPEAATDSQMDITLKKYCFGNLATKTHILPATAPLTGTEVLPQYNYGETNYPFQDMNGVSYCMENMTTTGLVENGSTYVIYQAEITLDGNAPQDPFFVFNKKLYLASQFDQLLHDALLTNQGYQITDGQAKFEAKGIWKYEDATCYYLAAIQDDANTTKVVRNNWYKLDVTGIKKLGYPRPEIIDKEDKAMMMLKVIVNPWKVKVNNIEF